MSDKHELTEKLKAIETEIYNDKIDLKTINSKLAVAYKYEEELNERMAHAKKHTNELREQFFIKSGEMSAKYDTMKDIFDVFTGNFYSNK